MFVNVQSLAEGFALAMPKTLYEALFDFTKDKTRKFSNEGLLLPCSKVFPHLLPLVLALKLVGIKRNNKGF